MSGQVILKITMRLLSDAIFGSGFSTPGGDDIGVYQDSDGYPYLKGSTLKGLLLESMENLSAWEGRAKSDVKTMMGVEGWEGESSERRIHVSSLRLENRPRIPEDCYTSRVFTALENGVVKDKTLRSAMCIRSGLCFSGEVECAGQDETFVKEALCCIKWAGTLRHRGFGQVKVTTEPVKEKNTSFAVEPCTCIWYRMKTQLPLMLVNLQKSRGNQMETRGYVPGSSIRGMVIENLSRQEPEWFEGQKERLLSGKVRFLNAVPIPAPDKNHQDVPQAVIPSPMGFYEDKAETVLTSVIIRDVDFSGGEKRAKLGEFCSLSQNVISYWSADAESRLRIQCSKKGTADTEMFQTRCLGEGQYFEGYILLDDPALAPAIARGLSKTVWLGADRYEGFGKCLVTHCQAAEAPAWVQYGYQDGDEIDRDFYLLALAPFTMSNGLGAPCGIDEAALASLMGVQEVKIEYASTSLCEQGSFNRTWHCRTPAAVMYDKGSVFHIRCSEAPAWEKLRQLQQRGIGMRRSEGFGQILFLRKSLLEGISQKQELSLENASEKQAKQESSRKQAQIRRAAYGWVMETEKQVQHFGLSKSQLGTVQALCEKAISQKGDTKELETFFEKNLEKRGVRHGDKFTSLDALLRQVLETRLTDTLQTDCEDSMEARLRLLCLLFNYSRKTQKEGKA